jgi:CRISPR-associated protein Cas5d
MYYGVKVHVWGELACFTRPEMKAERVSYDVITPSAARGILEAIYWKKSIRWIIDKIYVLNPIRFCNIRRNEVSSPIYKKNITSTMNNISRPLSLFIESDRTQRNSMVLRDVSYVIDAHFEAVENDGKNKGKHFGIFNRRIENGQCFNQPYLGCREFSAFFEPISNKMPVAINETRDLGWMLYDMCFDIKKKKDKCNILPMFFRAKIENGCISVPHPNSDEVKR